MLSILVGMFSMTLIFNAIGSSTNSMFQVTPMWHLVAGGFAFGTVYMATDPVSAAMTENGKYFYGLLIGILVVLGIAVTILNPLISGILAAGVWIYLVRMFRKQNKIVSNDQMEPNLIEGHLKRLKAFLIVAGFSFLVFIVGAIVHNVLHGLSEIEEPVSLIISLVAGLVFVLATAGGMVIFLKGRQQTE